MSIDEVSTKNRLDFCQFYIMMLVQIDRACMLTNEHVVTTAVLHHCSAFKTDSVLPARGKLFHSPLKAGSSLSWSAVCVIIYMRLFVRIIIMFFRFIYYHFGLEVFTAKV